MKLTASPRNFLVAFMFVFSIIFLFLRMKDIASLQMMSSSSNHIHPPTSSQMNQREGSLAILVQNPRRNFHSNHWFHIGEYFLSRSRDVDKVWKESLTQTSSNLPPPPPSSTTTTTTTTATTTTSTSEISSSHSAKTSLVVVVANSRDFALGLTKMTTFFLLLAFVPMDMIHSKVEIYDPYIATKAVLDGRASTSSQSCINSYGNPLAVYDPNKRPGFKFQFFHNNSSLTLDHVTTTCTPVSKAVGNLPLDSSMWFKNYQETVDLRNKIDQFCRDSNQYDSSLMRRMKLTSSSSSTLSSQDTTPATMTSKTFKIVVYDRNKNRNFVNLNDILSRLCNTMSQKGLTASWEAEILVHDEEMEPCLLYNSLRNANVLFTTHGFQSTALLFLPPGAVLFEVFPFQYFKNSYKALCNQVGIHHRFAQNSHPNSLSRYPLYLVPMDSCMKMRRCRSYARGDSVSMPDDHIDLVVEALLDVENGMLHAGNAPFSFHQ